MVFKQVEKLQLEYTDKYVVVDHERPELSRFKDMTGTVKTVNMNGHALVQFDANNNVGWFDIDIDYLKVIDEPLPKEEPPAAKAPAKKAPVAKAPATKTPVEPKPKPQQEAAPAKKPKPKPAESPMSVDDILAAARKPKGGSEPENVTGAMESGRTKKATADAPATKSDSPVAQDPKSMSVADILAAARAEKTGDPPSAADPGDEPEQAPPSAPDSPLGAEEPSASSGGSLPTDVAGIVAYCRERQKGSGPF